MSNSASARPARAAAFAAEPAGSVTITLASNES